MLKTSEYPPPKSFSFLYSIFDDFFILKILKHYFGIFVFQGMMICSLILTSFFSLAETSFVASSEDIVYNISNKGVKNASKTLRLLEDKIKISKHYFNILVFQYKLFS